MIKSLFGSGAKNKSSNDITTGRMQPKLPITVLDIGCRWGFAEKFLNEEYRDDFKIFGFDPDLEECKRLQEFYSHLPDGLVNCVPVALAEKPGKRNLYITKDPACSSLHPPIKYLSESYPALKCTELDKVISIDVESLENWASSLLLNNFDYIKVDTQGTELEILRGAGEHLLTTRCIDIEVEFNPIYQGQSLFGETDQFLRSKGFVLWSMSNLVHYSPNKELIELDSVNTVCFDENERQENKAYGGQLFWADARYIKSNVFLKESLDSEEQNARDVKLFKALGMYDVLNQIDIKSKEH